MKPKKYHIGTIKDSEIKKRIRKPITRVGGRMKSKKEYDRKRLSNTDLD
jgi:uncharacterized FAD-dependent dehydrogenase